MKNKDEVVETSNVRLSLGEDGIVRGVHLPGAVETLETAVKNTDVTTEFSRARGKKLPMLMDYRNLKSISREARDYYAGEVIAGSICACAIIIGNPISKVIANFYMGLNKPLVPTKLFTSEKEAIKWLNSFKE